jgi:hypothetical protein
MATLYGMQNKKKYAYCQSHATTSAVLPDMGQTEKERGGAVEPGTGVITSSPINTIKMYHNR